MSGYYVGECHGTISTPGVVAINSRKLFEIVKEYPHEDIPIVEAAPRWIEIGEGSVVYKIAGMNPEDFPVLPRVDSVHAVAVRAEEFHRWVSRAVVVQIPQNDPRAHLAGVKIDGITVEDKTILRATSTDGSLLTRADISATVSATDAGILGLFEGAIVPKNGLKGMLRSIGSEGTVRVYADSAYFVVSAGADNVAIRLLEGYFPDLSDIQAKQSSHEATFNRDDLVGALKRMSIFLSEDYPGAAFDFFRGAVTISAKNPNIGESDEAVKTDYDGPEMRITLNPRYLLDVASVCGGDGILLTIDPECESAVFVRPSNHDDFISAIMPMSM